MESVANSEQLRTVALIVAEYLEAGREMSAAIAALHAGDDLDFDAIEQRHAAAEEALTRLDPAGLRAQVATEAGIRGALEWYADPVNWERGLGREGPQDSPAMDDEGERARAAFVRVGGES